LIMTFKGRAITPTESSLSMILSSQPFPNIDRVIWIVHSSFTLRQEGLQVDLPLIFFDISIVDDCIFFCIIFQLNSKLYLFCVWIEHSECALSWLAFIDPSLINEMAIEVWEFAFATNFTLFHLTFVLELVLERSKFSISVGYKVKLSEIEKFTRHKVSSFPLFKLIFPLSNIVLFLNFVFLELLPCEKVF
jgi:hypothetical protein